MVPLYGIDIFEGRLLMIGCLEMSPGYARCVKLLLIPFHLSFNFACLLLFLEVGAFVVKFFTSA